ncbi:hypothetical protein V5F89_12540 [Pelagerythrobacter marensis]|uniref:Uncharacterized protein n=1 Tax=Pelagerythrobacter marensis TaxID=543877 RepID=A0ABZ2D2V0_9SPHN
MADYSSPKPIDPIAFQPHAYLRIHCRCGRRATYPVREFTRFHRLPGTMKFYELIARLRCEICGERPSSADVSRHP